MAYPVHRARSRPAGPFPGEETGSLNVICRPRPGHQAAGPLARAIGPLISTTGSLALALSLGACATYNDRVEAPVRAFEAGDFTAAEAMFVEVESSGSPFLSAAEAGTSAFVGGDFEGALDHLHGAEDAVRDVEERAVIGGEAITEDLLSLVINEGQKAYVGEGYERVMLHSMLGMCYLARGAPDDVLVEARRVDQLLTAEEQLYDADYRAGGLGHLLSAIAYELVGKPGEAFIDYKRMLEKGVGGELTTSALRRLGARLGRLDELDLSEEGEAAPRDWPSVVLVGGLGMGPVKREIRIDVPIDGGVFAWAVPDFDGGTSPATALDVVLPGRSMRVRASEVENVAAVAEQNLKDRIAWLAVRSAVRGLLKRQAAEQLRKNSDTEWLALAMDVFTIASERADLRTWRTLPQRWVAARIFLPPGEEVALELATDAGAAVELGSFRLQREETMFILARALQSGITAHVIGGEKLSAAQPETPQASNPSQPASGTPAPKP